MPEDLTLRISIDDQGTAVLKNLSRESRTAAAVVDQYGVALRNTARAEEQGNRSKNDARNQARRLIREQLRLRDAEGDRAKALTRTTEAQIRAATGSRRLAAEYRQAAEAAQRAEQRFRSSGRAAQTAGRSYLQTGTNIGFVTSHLIDAARLVVRFSRDFLEAGDTMLRVQGRLNLVTESSAQLEATQTALFRSAQRTGSEFETTVTLYSRMAQATQDLEISQASQLKVTEAINQSFQISGASTEGAKNATIQLTQALAGGIVRAEEFNSIVENSPELVQALARGLDAAGGSVGKLRQLIVEGKVTSEDFFQAIEKEAPGIAERFAKIPETFARASQRSGNELTRFLANLDRTTGISGKVAGAIGFLTETMDLYSRQMEHAERLQRDLNAAQDEGGQSTEDLAGRLELQRREAVADLQSLGLLAEAEAALGRGRAGAIAFLEASTAALGENTDEHERAAAAFRDFTSARQGLEQEDTARFISAEAEVRSKATDAVKAATTEIEKETAALQKKSDALTGATTSIDAETRATLEGTEAGRELVKTLDKQTAARDSLKKELEEGTQAKKDATKAEREAQAAAERTRRTNEASVKGLEAGNALLAEEIQIKREAIATGEDAAETEIKLALARLEAAAAQEGLTEAEREGLRERRRLLEQAREVDAALDAARDGTDILAESQREAILTTGDLRNTFSEMITGFLRGTRSLKDIGDTLADFAKGVGANLFKNLLFGKEGQFDKPLIGNVQGLFGPGGVIPNLFQQGGANSFFSFTQGFFGQSSQLPSGIAGPSGLPTGGSGFGGLGAAGGTAGLSAAFFGSGPVPARITSGALGAAAFIPGPQQPFVAAAAFIASLFGGGLFNKPGRIAVEKKGIDQFYQQAVGVDLPRSEKKVGRYLGPAREGPLASSENALTAAGVLYALEADEGGLGTVARFRNQGLAGFQRAGLSETQGQEKALRLAGALGGQSPEDLIAGLNRALSGDF